MINRLDELVRSIYDTDGFVPLHRPEFARARQ